MLEFLANTLLKLRAPGQTVAKVDSMFARKAGGLGNNGSKKKENHERTIDGSYTRKGRPCAAK